MQPRISLRFIRATCCVIVFFLVLKTISPPLASVARMERSVIRVLVRGDAAPDFASLHPGYLLCHSFLLGAQNDFTSSSKRSPDGAQRNPGSRARGCSPGFRFASSGLLAVS